MFQSPVRRGRTQRKIYIFFKLLIYTLHIRAYEPFVVRPKKKLYKYTNSVLISCFRVCEYVSALYVACGMFCWLLFL